MKRSEMVEIINKKLISCTYGYVECNLKSFKEVADILGTSPIDDRWYCRYDKTNPFPSITDHYQTRLKSDGYVDTLIYASDIDRWSHLGAWVVTIPEPATLLPLGFGVMLVRRKHLKVEK